MTYTNHLYSSVKTKKVDTSVIKNSVNKLAENMLQGKSVFNYSNQVLRVIPADVIRYVSQSAVLASSDVYRNSIISFVLSCEKNCAGSGLVFLLLLSGNSRSGLDKKLRLTELELKEAISFYLGNGLILKEVLDLFFKCGFEYKVDYGDHQSSNIQTNISTMQKISGFIDPLFHDLELDDQCILVCVDGAIESLGEIDPLLQWSMQNNKKAILLAKHFNPDVSNTLRTNWESGTLSVLPYVLDEDGLVAAKLIAQEVISIETGLRLSNVEFDSYNLIQINKKQESYLYASQGNKNGDGLKVDILFPQRLKSMHALLEERMRFGIALTKNCLLKGLSTIYYKNEKLRVPTVCLEYANRAAEEWKKIENISCIITLEQKNVY